MGEGREGDWDAGIGITHSVRSVIDVSSLGFLSTPKLLPIPNGLHRIGDWICTGCSNNNYASREKCGQPKEVAAMPAIAMPRASLQTYSHYFARVHGGPGLKMDIGLTGNAALQQSLPPNSNWPFGGTGKYGLQSASSWPLGASNNAVYHMQISFFWFRKDGVMAIGFATVVSITTLLMHRQQQSFQGFEQMAGCSNDQTPGIYAPYPSGSSAKAQNLQAHMQIPHMTRMPTLLGKG
ncbi:hypothetical protein HHK36_026384 [Tetracentron sinense]|uniref:RanBP2-type domain-containing protein n=1 Tax=Tetracentron sinense TaxID=13715 RepID=A0A834YGT1_TETSI|nr:hypothetical protein HHK36_026384 [Tetracentron sinense]